MSGAQQQVTERVFGDDGQTVEEIVEQVDSAIEEVAEEVPVEAGHKYRIGDKRFATQAEAITYAEGQTQPASDVDAYRQLLRETAAARLPLETVTAAAEPEFNAEEMYTDPNAFLKKFSEKIKSETLNSINQNQATKDADERVWFEFRERHPDLAEFREEITGLASRMQPEVQGVARSKGPAAAYDYVATKFKAQVERHAAALQPKRVLKNGSGSTPAGGKVETVTPKTAAKKPLSFAEQIRSIRKRR